MRAMGGQVARRLALLGAILLSAPSVSAERVFSEFDLLGWRRAGVVSVEAGALEGGTVADLLDRSVATVADVPSRVTLVFDTPQLVRDVTLVPGGTDRVDVTLTVVAEDGRRFAAGEESVADGRHAVFHLLDVLTDRLEFAVSRPGGGAVPVAGVRVLGALDVDRLNLEGVPDALPEGGAFPLVVTGRDSFGGRPDLTSLVRVGVTPARAVSVEGGRLVMRASGPITLAAHLGDLESPRRDLMVQKLLAAPAAPALTPGHRQIRVHLEGEPPFEVFRRPPGGKSGRAIGRADGHLFFDDDVEPGSAHQYSVRRIDAFGNPLTEVSAETRGRAHSQRPAGALDLGRLPVLVVVYQDSLEGGAEEARRIEESLEAARLFVFRHSAGRLHLDLTFLRRSGPTPSTAGPTMALVERDLRRHGIADDAYGLVFVLAGDLDGSWGNFSLLGGTAGAFGRDASVPTPPGALGPDPAAAWNFVHELQHVLNDRVAASVGVTGLPTGHFDQDYATGRLGGSGLVLDVGEAWDGQAALLRLTESWAEVGPPFRRPHETVDADGDGFPDDDPALAIDEARYGSSPTTADTDDDGLGDLSELMAGLYGGTDPTAPDTDDDGLRDGDDPWPLSDFTGRIPHGDTPAFVAAGPDPRDPAVRLDAGWTASALVLRVATRAPCDVFLDLDGSGALGRWETDTLVGVGDDDASTGGSDVYAGPARLSIRAHEDPTGVYVGQRPLPEATLVATEEDGWSVVTVTLPPALGPGASDVHVREGATPADGLRLEAGRVLGLGVTVHASTAGLARAFDAWRDDVPWVSLFEPHRLLDATLAAPEETDAPDGEHAPTEPVGEPAGEAADPSEPDEVPQDGADDGASDVPDEDAAGADDDTSGADAAADDDAGTPAEDGGSAAAS